MIKFYYSTAPNPMKVALCLEEMGLPYEPIPVDTRKAEQHKPGYLAINPNAKVPSIVDGEVTMFDSNAIVLYLADKTGKFLPQKAAERGPMLSWLMFVASGIRPFTGAEMDEEAKRAMFPGNYRAQGCLRRLLSAPDGLGEELVGLGEAFDE